MVQFLRNHPRVNCIRGVIIIVGFLAVCGSGALMVVGPFGIIIFAVGGLAAAMLMHPFFERFARFNRPLV